MRSRMKRLLWVIVALWPILTAQTFATKPYSAETVLKTKSTEMVSRICVGGKDRWRVEMVGQPQVQIVRLDRKVMYTLLPPSKSYFEMPMTDEEASPAFKAESRVQGKVTRKPLGTEQVGGRPTRKYEVTITAPGQKPRVMYEWFSEELGVPLKMMPADQTWSMEYRNVKLGPQDPKLFEVPAGFTKMSLPTMPGPAARKK